MKFTIRLLTLAALAALGAGNLFGAVPTATEGDFVLRDSHSRPVSGFPSSDPLPDARSARRRREGRCPERRPGPSRDDRKAEKPFLSENFAGELFGNRPASSIRKTQLHRPSGRKSATEDRSKPSDGLRAALSALTQPTATWSRRNTGC